MPKSKEIKVEEKIRIVQECIEGKISQAQAAEIAGVSQGRIGANMDSKVSIRRQSGVFTT